MEMRYHKGFGHGLRPGETSDMNCPSCKREDSARLFQITVADEDGTVIVTGWVCMEVPVQQFTSEQMAGAAL